MKTVTYESIKADQAWVAVTQHLHRRNQLLSDGVNYLENHSSDKGLAGRLVVLQYHLRATVRRLAGETATIPPANNLNQQVNRQWMIVHQLHFLLRQIDDELRQTGARSTSFRGWMDSRQTVVPYKVTYLN